MKRKDFLKRAGFSFITAAYFPMFYSESERSQSNSGLIKPPRLKPGDTIGLISPAGILPSAQEYDKIIETISNLGFKTKEGTNARKQFGYFAGTDKERADDLHAMFEDTEVSAIMPFRGGWGSGRLLDHLDFEVIKNNPKILVGFSDITTLLLSISDRTGLVTFHGPVGKSEWTSFTFSHFKKAVMQKEVFIMKNPADSETKIINPGIARGKLVGGNLSVITSLMGSGYLPDFNNSILFLEDVGEEIYRIDRMLTQMRLNGILNSINGFIFGQCAECTRDSEYSFTLDELLNEIIRPLGIPAFSGSMIGHIDNNFTIPIGVEAELDAERGLIRLLEPGVS